jgi:hypothetical protein
MICNDRILMRSSCPARSGGPGANTKLNTAPFSRAPSFSNQAMQQLVKCGTLKFEGAGRRPEQFHQKPDTSKKSGEKTAAAELKNVKTPYADCTPKAATLHQVWRVTPNVTGITDATADPGGVELIFKDGYCQTKVTAEPKLTFGHFMYTKDGTYPLGREAGTDQCRGKAVNAFLHVTPDLADRISQAEVEHCNDMHRAFNLTYQAAIQIFHTLENPGIKTGDPNRCGDVIGAKVKDAIGVEPAKLADAYTCLYNKSKDRDDAKWHTVERGKPKYDAGCQSVTYSPDAKTALPELAKHSSEEVVKGCRVKE